MLKVHGLANFKKACDAFVADIDRNARTAAVGLAKRTFEKILYLSPQYSGDFVANWKVEYGSVTPSFTEFAVGKRFPDPSPFKRGDSPAIQHAKGNAHWALPALGQSIFIHNSAVHDEDAYGWRIEMGKIALRPVNTGATHVMSRSVAEMLHRYATIGNKQMDTLRKI